MGRLVNNILSKATAQVSECTTIIVLLCLVMYFHPSFEVSSAQQVAEAGESIIKDQRSLYRWSTTRVTKSESLQFVSFQSHQYGWAASKSGKLFNTVTGGVSWRQVNMKNPPKTSVSALHFFSRQEGWIALRLQQEGSDSFHKDKTWIIHTSNGGNSWEVQYQDFALQLHRIFFENQQEGWAVGSRLKQGTIPKADVFILHTSDGGRHWDDRSEALKKSKYEQRFAGFATDFLLTPLATIDLLTAGGQILSSQDNGENWASSGLVPDDLQQTMFTRIMRDKDGKLIAMGSTDSKEGMWSLTSYSKDKLNWTGYRAIGLRIKDVILLGDGQLVACGSMRSNNRTHSYTNRREGVVLYSSDTGKTWNIIYRDPNTTSVNSVSVVNPFHIWAVCENGLVVSIQRGRNDRRQ